MKTTPLEEFVDFIVRDHGNQTWIPLFQSLNTVDKTADGALYTALVSKDKAASTLQNNGWDLMLSGGGPGFSTSWEDGNQVTTYHTTYEPDFRRLAICRDFHGRVPSYFELSEEFRRFHNLYNEKKSNLYLAFDDAGDEVEVAKIKDEEVLVRRSFLRSFMAATQMDLILFFELTKHSSEVTDFSDEYRDEHLTFTRYSGPSYVQGYKSFTRILGKKLIPAPPMEDSGVWPFKQKEDFQTFVIGGDVDRPWTYSCDPDGLANYFGANPDAPHYLTPVFFDKQVLQKYYGSADYEVHDGYLMRRGAWTLRLDNNSPTHVAVFLGDLGRDLPEKEQRYWRSFNLIPNGHRISETNFQRSFLGSFYDAISPDLKFKAAFESLREAWFTQFEWDLFLRLDEKDFHFYKSLRSLLANQQSEFDSQVLALAKVTIDSINVKSLRRLLGNSDSNQKSIDLMGELFKFLNIPDSLEKIAFLRGVQSVRSTGVAHRKGTEYEKVIAKLQIDEEDYRGEFDNMLTGFVEIMESINKAIAR